MIRINIEADFTEGFNVVDSIKKEQVSQGEVAMVTLTLVRILKDLANIDFNNEEIFVEKNGTK